MALLEKYQRLCQESNVKCNSAIKKQLESPTFTSDIQLWDLSGNMVGAKGLAVILKLIQESLPNLQTFRIAGNNLASSSTQLILQTFVSHPAIISIDLSGNDIRLGGPELVELLKKNHRITTLNVDNTHLRPLFTRLIEIQLNKNSGGKPPEASRQQRFSFGSPAEGEDANVDDNSKAFGEHVSFQTGAGDSSKRVPRRPTVCSEVYKEEEIDNFKPEVFEKTPEVRSYLRAVLERHDLFSHLEDFELYIAIDAMAESSRTKGDVLFEEGDEDGDMFYFIFSGEVELKRKSESIAVLKKGDTTQDLMLLYPGTYNETATCLSDATIFTLDRRTYRIVLSKASKKKRSMYEGFLSSVGFLKCLTKPELLQLADALKPAQYEAGATLIRYGEPGEAFFLIVEGTVEVWGRDDHKNPIKVCEFTVGDCVGELEFIRDHKCVADVKAKTPLRVAKMNRHHFELVMGPVVEVLARNASESTVYEYYRGQLAKMEEKKDGA